MSRASSSALAHVGTSGTSALKLERTPLREYPESQHWLDRCRAAHIPLHTLHDLLNKTELELAEHLDLHEWEVKQLLATATASKAVPVPLSIFAQWQQDPQLGLRQQTVALSEQDDAEEKKGELGNPGGAASHVEAASSKEAEVAALAEAIAASLGSMLSLDRAIPQLRINKGITEVRAQAGWGALSWTYRRLCSFQG